MPIYDFVCQECSNNFDKLVGFDWKAAGVACPSCGAQEVRKLVSLVGGFKSEGKVQSLGGKSACESCSTTSCSTC